MPEDPALARAIAGAEEAMKAMRLTKNPEEKSRLREQAKQQLQQAEDLKKAADVSASHSIPSRNAAVRLEEPTNTRILLKNEQILLLKASYLNGQKFPPWTGQPSEAEFLLIDDESLYTDNATFSLSPYQQRVFVGWERPDIALAPNISSEIGVVPIMNHVNSIDLVQDASTDCSVIASLCAVVARAMRGHARLLPKVLFPQDGASIPTFSHNGKYVLRLNFNGSYRRVVIDDRLPKSKAERVIHVIDRHNPTLLWPALLEKAYLKVRGGYDFPGSNSATDLWIITGWIPEQVFLQCDDLDLDKFWTKILNAFTYGDVLVTMGTGKIAEALEKEVGLAGEHDYAVLDLREVNGQRLMLVKNPWCEGTSWYRVPQRQKKPVGCHSLATNHDDQEVAAAASPRDMLNADDQLSPGTFWMDIDNAAQYFQSIYLNWNPGLFSFRQDLHFSWDLSPIGSNRRGQHASLYHHPQFSISTTSGGSIWLLLCRHLQDSAEAAQIDLTGFIALSASASAGKRIKLIGRSIARSNFVDSPQILLKLDDCEARTPYTILPLEQELSATVQTFTLSAFSNSILALDHASSAHQYAVRCSASWTKDTAGGNANSPLYSSNPQFAVTVAKATRLSVLLETMDEEINVHIKLLHGKGQRVRHVRNRDIIFDSSDYRRRCCVAGSKTLVEAGAYTMICSTFEAQQHAAFDLLVEADEHVTLSQLPREGAGRLQTIVKATFPAHSSKIAAMLVPKRLANTYMIARGADDALASSMPLRIAIEQGHGLQRRVLTSSGDEAQVANDIKSARLDEFDLSPGMLRYGDIWIVLERVCVADRAGALPINLHCFTDQANALEVKAWSVLED